MDERMDVRAMMGFIDASPSPFHACAEAARQLEAAGFRRVEEAVAWEGAAGRRYALRGGSLVAWALEGPREAHRGFRVAAAHTDSPNLRIKPRPDTGCAGWRQLAVEVYGSALLNSWLDRDLGLSGRAMVREGSAVRERLVLADRPLLRVPQLAIHLDREVNDKGLKLDKQKHMTPAWALGRADEPGLRAFLAEELEVDPGDVLAFDLMCHDVQKASLLGARGELVSSARLDNLCSSWCALEALIAHVEGDDAAGGPAPVLCLFDHEEVGSGSARGAASPLLEAVLERAVLASGGSREDYHRAVAASFCASIDMAHATHPNYPERHEPGHWIAVNGGPVIKIHTGQRYATDAEGEAVFQQACERAGVPVQRYSHRSDLPCGSTIGPITAARIGMRTLDVGNPQLSMHSARELCGADDPGYMVRALRAFFAPEGGP